MLHATYLSPLSREAAASSRRAPLVRDGRRENADTPQGTALSKVAHDESLRAPPVTRAHTRASPPHNGTAKRADATHRMTRSRTAGPAGGTWRRQSLAASLW